MQETDYEIIANGLIHETQTARSIQLLLEQRGYRPTEAQSLAEILCKFFQVVKKKLDRR